MKRKHHPPPTDRRDEAHRQCAAMMARIDALPRETRLHVYEHNEMPRKK